MVACKLALMRWTCNLWIFPSTKEEIFLEIDVITQASFSVMLGNIRDELRSLFSTKFLVTRRIAASQNWQFRIDVMSALGVENCSPLGQALHSLR